MVLSIRGNRSSPPHLARAGADAGFLDVLTGLRVGELLGPEVERHRFSKTADPVTRSIVMQHLGDCKTEASRKPVPLDLRLANPVGLAAAKSLSYRTRTGFLLALTSEENCRTGQARCIRRIRASGEEARNRRALGWHTFRHTYATLLKATART